MDGNYSSNWNMRDLLADLMGTKAELKPEPRGDIWASDLGKPYVDRWLQMKGVPYSNPPGGKDLMAFFLGKQIEFGIKEMLTRCGLAYRSQDRVNVRCEDCLPVVGRPDLVVEVGDWQKVMAAVDDGLDEGHADPAGKGASYQALKRLLGVWQERCPEGLCRTVFEVKSLNSEAFRHHRNAEGFSKAYPHHRLQLYTYLRGLGLTEGHLVYIARDTGWMEEVVIRPTEELEGAWRQDVETISRYYRTDERPPLEPRMVNGRENWQIRYSRYKDYLYHQEVCDGAFSF